MKNAKGWLRRAFLDRIARDAKMMARFAEDPRTADYILETGTRVLVSSLVRVFPAQVMGAVGSWARVVSEDIFGKNRKRRQARRGGGGGRKPAASPALTPRVN